MKKLFRRLALRNRLSPRRRGAGRRDDAMTVSGESRTHRPPIDSSEAPHHVEPIAKRWQLASSGMLHRLPRSLGLQRRLSRPDAGGQAKVARNSWLDGAVPIESVRAAVI